MRELKEEELKNINDGHWWTAFNSPSGMWDGIKLGAAGAGVGVLDIAKTAGRAFLNGEIPLV